MTEPTVHQIKAARALLEWKQPDLALAAGVGVATVKRCEAGTKSITVVSEAIRRALENAGIEFIPAKNGKGVGVRLRSD